MGLLDVNANVAANTANSDPIAQALGVANQQSLAMYPPIPVVINAAASTIDNDQEFARKNLYDVVNKTSEAINELMQISSQSQHPRAYEVLEKLLMRQQDAASMLLKIHKARKDIDGATDAPPPSVSISNAVFVGTTSELLDALRGKNREVIEHDDLLE